MMVIRWAHILAVAAAVQKSDKPWKARTAAASSWAGARVALLWRGMHYGSYKSERHRNKIIHVNANHWSVHENHVKKVVGPLERAGANVTVFACSHHSDVAADWLKNAGVSRSDIVLKDHKKQILPNELLRRAYALVERYDWDVLLSLRADIVLKRDVVDLMRRDATAGSADSPTLWLPFHEVYIGQDHHCTYKERRLSEKCLAPWRKHGMRFSDAALALPRVEIKYSTRLQCERTRQFRRNLFGSASRTRRERSIRPKVSRIDFDVAELEHVKVWSMSAPRATFANSPT